MIISFIVNIFLGLLTSIINLLPSGTGSFLDGLAATVDSSFFAHLAWLNQFLPVAFLGHLVVAVFALYTPILAFRVGRYIYGLTPFSGGGGD